jgi:PAS domain S-box-containing protein
MQSAIPRKTRPWGIRARLILGVASILVILMSLLVLKLMNNQKNFFLRLNRDRALNLSNLLAYSSASYVTSYELAALQKLVYTYRDIPGIRYAMVISEDKIVLAHSNEKYIGQIVIDSISAKLRQVNTPQTLLESNSILDIASPITNNGKIIGWARIGLSQEYIEPSLQEIRDNGIVFIVISLVVGSLFALMLAGRLTNALHKLLNAAKEIKGGQRNVRVKPSGSFEVSQLGTAFNQMLDDISANEKLLSLVLENLPVSVRMLDERGRITSANPASREIWKGNKYAGMDQLHPYKGWFTETGREVQDQEWGASVALREGRRILNQEIEIECLDKSHKIILNSGIPLRDNGGKLTRVIAIEVDITEHKESELLFKNLVEKSLVGVYIIQAGKFVYVNPKLAQILGYSKEEMLNLDSFRAIVDENYIPAELEEWRRKVDAGIIDDFHIELKYRRKNGKIIWAEVFCGETLYKGSKAILGTFQDITERKEADERIRESEAKFRMSFMTSRDAFYIGTLDGGRIIDVNNSFNELFGYTREESIGKTLAELQLYFYPEDRERMVAGLKTSGHLKDLEITCRKKDGGLIIVSATINVWQMNNDEVIMAVISDITDRKRVETELIENKEQMALFVEYSPASLAMFDKEMRYLATSRRWKTDYNLGEQNIIGKTHYEVFPEAGQEWKDIHQRCLNGTIERKEEDSFTRFDGTTDWLKWEIRPWHKASGKIGGIIMFTEVITEQKESALKFKNLVENALVGVYIIQKGKFVYVNPRFAGNLGYTQEEMVNMEDARQIVFEEDKSIASEQWRKREYDGVTYIHVELRYQRKDGAIIWAEVNSNETLYKGTKAIIGTFQDITERRNAEAVIKEQAEVFTAITENANESMWLVSPDLKVLQFNKTAQDRIRLNRGKEIYKGANFSEYIYIDTEDVFMPMFNDALAGKYAEGESSHINIHGNLFWQRTRMYPIYRTQKELIGVTILAEDITSRKEIDEKIEQSEERNRALIENITDAIILLDESLQPIYRSPSVTKILGFSPEELIDKTVFDSIHPDDLPKSRTFFQRVHNSPGIPIQSQFRLLHKHGHYIWVEGTIINMLLNKSINAVIVNYRDITERKKFEEQQLLIASIVNSSDDAIISKDLNGIITSWNKGAEKVLCFAFEEVIGRHISMIIPPELIGEEEAILSRVREGESLDHYETRRMRKGGVLIDVSITISPITDAAGNITGASKILRDITEWKRAEESIRQSEANYRQLFDNSPAPMWVIDEGSAAIVQANQACIKNYGYSEEEFRSITIRDISPDEPKHASGVNGNDLGVMVSHRHRKKSGELIDVVTSSIPVILNGKKSILRTAIDVTEKNLYEQKLTKASIKAQEEERYEIGGELHDNVCQILVSALINLKMMKEALTPVGIEYFDQASEYISNATEEIRNLSHRLAPALFDEESLENAFEDLLTKFNVEKKFEILLRFDRFAKKRILGRELQLNLYRILQEQLKNILKHAHATRVEVFVSIYNEVLLFRIIDNGVGLDVQQGKKGIGLANMNRRIELFSGQLEIISPQGGGCEVRVEIPLAKAPPVKRKVLRR